MVAVVLTLLPVPGPEGALDVAIRRIVAGNASLSPPSSISLHNYRAGEDLPVRPHLPSQRSLRSRSSTRQPPAARRVARNGARGPLPTAPCACTRGPRSPRLTTARTCATPLRRRPVSGRSGHRDWRLPWPTPWPPVPCCAGSGAPPANGCPGAPLRPFAR